LTNNCPNILEGVFSPEVDSFFWKDLVERYFIKTLYKRYSVKDFVKVSGKVLLERLFRKNNPKLERVGRFHK
jgi:hypothetical protein